jgi:hypothetical protein
MGSESIDTAQQAPRRMTITNLLTADFLEAQYNPEELGEDLAVVWQELMILGQSHQELQYQATRNHVLDFELGFDALTRPANYDSADAIHARDWIMSLAYSSRASSSVGNGAPPGILFTWPNFLSLRCKVVSMHFRNWRFSQSGPPSGFKVKMQVKEWRAKRLYMEDVLASGSIRPGVSNAIPSGAGGT